MTGDERFRPIQVEAAEHKLAISQNRIRISQADCANFVAVLDAHWSLTSCK